MPAAPGGCSRGGRRPPWVAAFERAYDSGEPAQVVAAQPSPQTDGLIAFAPVIEPLLREARSSLAKGILQAQRRAPEAPIDGSALVAQWAADLPAQCSWILNRTLALELHVARLGKRLAGETPEQRFSSFVAALRRPGAARELFAEYPVLARAVTERVARWVATHLETLRRLGADWPDLQRAFPAVAAAGRLTAIAESGADLHRGGRAVACLRFERGPRLIYKPRSLAVEADFQGLLAWVNQQGLSHPFRVLGVLDRGTHGWMEFVEATPCPDLSAVRRFYEREGALLALLYALEAIDGHHENLIAAGEHPVLVDLETLFHPRPESACLADDHDRLSEQLRHTVLRVGLLPLRIDGVESSGLGGQEGQFTGHPLPAWEDVGKDLMRMVRRPAQLNAASNRPTLAGVEVNAADHLPALLAGFRSTYRLLLARRRKLFEPGGPFARFARDEVRVVLRPTAFYAELLGDSFHPDLLRNAVDRERFFGRLRPRAEEARYLNRVVSAERQDLRAGDVPRFTTRVDSRSLWTARGKRLPGFLPRTGLDLVSQRLDRMSEEDLDRQSCLIRASLALLADGARPGAVPIPPTSERNGSADANANACLKLAWRIGERLERLAFRHGRRATWIGLTPQDEQHWTLLPLGTDLYGGLPGVILFLAYLAKITREERFAELARAALATARDQQDRFWPRPASIGALTGWGGWIYALAHLASLWRQSDCLTRAEELADTVRQQITQDQTLDVVGGAAGAIAGLLCLRRLRPSARTLEIAVRCGDWLIRNARPMDPGLGWPSPANQNRALLGFAHGAAGIAWALAELFGATGMSRFREAASLGMAYERSRFSAPAGNWPDLREALAPAASTGGGPTQFMTAWCHGAPGIGLARLNTLRLMDDAETRAEIEVALNTTLKQGFGGNHSLCHGDLGNLELLLEAGRVLGEARWQEETRRVAGRVLASIKQNGWLCGVPHQVETPGLMTGLAGIGYAMLRFAAPDRVPSVLTLEPPVEAG